MLQAIKRVQYQVYYSPRVDETIIQGRSYWGGGAGDLWSIPLQFLN